MTNVVIDEDPATAVAPVAVAEAVENIDDDNRTLLRAGGAKNSARSGMKPGAGGGGASVARGAGGGASIARGSVARGSVARSSVRARSKLRKNGKASSADYGVAPMATPSAHLAVERLFSQASAVFPASAILDIFIAHVRFFVCWLVCMASFPLLFSTCVSSALQFMDTLRGNKLLTRLHMHAATLKSDSLSIDIQYFVYTWARQREKLVSAPTLKMTVEKRIRFEAMFHVAQGEVSKTRVLVHSFWSALA